MIRSKFILFAACSILIACSSLKKGSDTKMSKSVEQSVHDTKVTDKSPQKADSFAPVHQNTFDLSFLDHPSIESYVDTSGNLIINDSILEIKLRHFLKLQPNALISISTVDSITILNLNGESRIPDDQKIRNISALAYFKSLKTLQVKNNLIRNVSPIENLNKLEVLDLSVNRITNISALQKLYNLKDLNLYGNGISDISYLSNLTKLQKLNLWANGLFKIDSLKNLIELTDLNLGRNYIRDLSPIRNLSKLKNLWLIENLIQNPEIISECGANLSSLSLVRCRISDIQFLENCTQLKELLIFDNQITDISVLEKMVNLNTFLAGNNQISNMDVLPVLVEKGAFKTKGKFAENINIDLSNNRIDYQTPTNQKINKYLIDNVYKVKF